MSIENVLAQIPPWAVEADHVADAVVRGELSPQEAAKYAGAASAAEYLASTTYQDSAELHRHHGFKVSTDDDADCM